MSSKPSVSLTQEVSVDQRVRNGKGDLGQEISNRVDGAAYPMMLLIFGAFAYYIPEAPRLAVSIVLFALMTVILELGYRLSTK